MTKQKTKAKVWCKHILIIPSTDTANILLGNQWYSADEYINELKDIIPHSWTYCPICGAKRPKK